MNAMATLLRSARERSRLTQSALARRAEIPQGTLSRLETGSYKDIPPPEVIAGLARELDIPQHEFLQALGYDVGPSPSAPPEDPVRAELVEKLTRVQLSPDRVEGLEAILDRWLRRDRVTRERIEQQGTRAYAESQHG